MIWLLWIIFGLVALSIAIGAVLLAVGLWEAQYRPAMSIPAQIAIGKWMAVGTAIMMTIAIIVHAAIFIIGVIEIVGMWS